MIWTENDEVLESCFTNLSTLKVQSRPNITFLKGLQRFCYYKESMLPKIRDQIEDEDIWKENNGGYLRNYIQYYFSRLLEERKVLTLKDTTTNDIYALMWCVGLTDSIERTPLYAIAVRTTENDHAAVCQSTGHRPPYMLTITTRSNKVLFSGNHLRSGKDYIKYMSGPTKLPPLPLTRPLPLAAQFLFDRTRQSLVPGQLLMFDAFGISDPSTAIDITHVFPDADTDKNEYTTRKSRIPEKYHHLSDTVLIRRMRDGLTHAVQMAILNPRLGVPQFFNHSVQLLLPISLDEDTARDFEPDVVLALSWNTNQGAYVVETMLTVAMAKGNARLVQRLDQDWLKKPAVSKQLFHSFRLCVSICFCLIIYVYAGMTCGGRCVAGLLLLGRPHAVSRPPVHAPAPLPVSVWLRQHEYGSCVRPPRSLLRDWGGENPCWSLGKRRCWLR